MQNKIFEASIELNFRIWTEIILKLSNQSRRSLSVFKIN